MRWLGRLETMVSRMISWGDQADYHGDNLEYSFRKLVGDRRPPNPVMRKRISHLAWDRLDQRLPSFLLLCTTYGVIL